MQLYDCAEDFLSFCGDSPSTSPRYLGDQFSDVKPLEQSAGFVDLASTAFWVFAGWKDLATDVFVVETMNQMISREHGLKKPDIRCGGWIKAGIASLSDYFSLREPCYQLVGRRRVIDDREGFQIPVIGSSGNTLELVEIRHPFIHGAPDHLLVPISLSQTANAKFTRVVDNRLDPQDLAEFIVHLQPVVFHAMFDASSWLAFLFAVGKDFTLEVAMQLTTQKSKDVLGPEVDGGVVQQSLVEGGQFTLAGEDHVGGIFGLGDGPIVAAAWLQPGLAQDGVELASPTVQLPNPRQPAETVCQTLDTYRGIHFGKGVVVLTEANALFDHLAGEPIVSVDVNLHGVGEPGLDAHVHQAEFFIDAVIVEDPLGSVSKVEFGSLTAMTKLDGAAGLLAAEDGHKPLVDGILSNDVLDESLLAKLPLLVDIGSTCRLGQGLGMLDQRMGVFFKHRDKIFAPHPQHVVDKRVQLAVVPKWKISFENDSIKTAQRCYNHMCELVDEIIHGVLLLADV